MHSCSCRIYRISNARTIEGHIADLLGLFLSVDFEDEDQTAKFGMFVTIRSIQKLHARLKIGKKRRQQPLSTTLGSWRPVTGDRVESFSLARPIWASTFVSVDEEMKKLRSDNNWEFTINTAHLWASVLATLLDETDDAIKRYKESSARDKRQPLQNPTYARFKEICWFYHTLFILMTEYTRVVKELLAIPSLAASFQLSRE